MVFVVAWILLKPNFRQTPHLCIQSVLGVSEDNERKDLYPWIVRIFIIRGGRSDAYTVIKINMMSGRTLETQKSFIKQIFLAVEKEPGKAAIDLEITIKEQPAHCWGFHGKTGDDISDLSYQINV